MKTGERCPRLTEAYVALCSVVASIGVSWAVIMALAGICTSRSDWRLTAWVGVCSVVVGVLSLAGAVYANREVPVKLTPAERLVAAEARTAEMEREAGLRFDGIFMLPGYHDETAEAGAGVGLACMLPCSKLASMADGS